jgi:hypothetical protein
MDIKGFKIKFVVVAAHIIRERSAFVALRTPKAAEPEREAFRQKL